MPYRRLPNTDTARIRAMKTALEMGREISPLKLAFSAKTLIHLQRFLSLFEQNIIFQRQALNSQFKKTKNYNEIIRKARIYLTHFIKVMNMAIYRGEIPVETRAYYGLATNDSAVPLLNTENELLSWGRRIIDGEEFRIKKGGTPVSNPTIAVVKVRFGQFVDALNNNTFIEKKNLEYSAKLRELRNAADKLILILWNEVELYFSNLPDADKRMKCGEYGIVYFYRKRELTKTETEEPRSIVA